MTTPVRWTAAENKQLARYAAMLREANPKLTVIASCRESQAAVLPPNRQRIALAAASQVQGFWDELEVAEKELKALRVREAKAAQKAQELQARQAQEAEANQPEPEPDPVEAAAPVGADADAAERVDSELPAAPAVTAPAPAPISLFLPAVELLPFSDLENAFAAMFRRAMFRALSPDTPPPAGRQRVPTAGPTAAPVQPAPQPAPQPVSEPDAPVESAVSEPVIGAPREAWRDTPIGVPNMAPVPIPAAKTPSLSVVPRHNPEPIPSPEYVRRPRVVVIGLLPAQVNIVTEDLGELLDIRAFGNDLAPNMRAACQGADLVAMCKKFVSHDIQDLINSVGARHVRIKGGASDVKTYLRKWLAYTPEQREQLGRVQMTG